mmetsp:Transcript_299/g.840  ORF Transcript_299/g.840 Transcript_299/m.840 type:complete len:212 (+) Transcript_299:355-990(+)
MSARILRQMECTRCAISGVATFPVPMAQTGSYAITTRSISSGLIPARPFFSCTSQTSPTKSFSNSASVSPMHNITDIPCSISFKHCALMYSSVSLLMVRRSECPANAHSTPMLFSIPDEIPPVNAPAISGVTISAPTLSFPSTAFCTHSMKGNGTNKATSPGESGFTAFAMPVASSTASSLVDGLSFQFPVMKGFRSKRAVSDGRPIPPKE